MVICLEQGADLHMSQLMPLPLTVSCFSKIQIGSTFVVPAHQVSPGKRAIKWVCVVCNTHSTIVNLYRCVLFCLAHVAFVKLLLCNIMYTQLFCIASKIQILFHTSFVQF